MKCRDQCAENKPQHQEKRLNLRLSRRQISPFASSAFHPLQSRKKMAKKTTTKQLNKMPWREAETNPTSKYRLHQQLYLLWNRRNAQPKALRSLLQLIHVHLHGDKKSQVLEVLSLTGGKKTVHHVSHFSALTGDLLFATAPVGENKCQKGRVRKGR